MFPSGKQSLSFVNGGSSGSPHRGPGQRAYETHRSAISEPEAALLSWHLHGSVFLLKVQGQDEVPGLSFAPQAKL